ncbi:acyl carrier protein [Streptomyces sp. NPDC048182]|uniref:acyl carrier protein n=1 Tax=unclassified Streptomyces TaxID=2593676 RepID=UPI0033A56670
MPDTPDVRDEVLETLSEVLDTSEGELREQPRLAAHQWDSLSSLRAFVQLEERLGVTLDLRTFNTARSVDDIVRLVAA